MKKVETIQEIRKTVVQYESVDGNLFDTEEACKQWEKSYEGTIMACFKKVPQIETNSSAMYFEYNSEEDTTYIVRPRHMEDVQVINNLLQFVCKNGKLLTHEDINQDYIINFGYDGLHGDFYDLFALDAYLDRIANHYSTVREKMNEVCAVK